MTMTSTGFKGLGTFAYSNDHPCLKHLQLAVACCGSLDHTHKTALTCSACWQREFVPKQLRLKGVIGRGFF